MFAVLKNKAAEILCYSQIRHGFGEDTAEHFKQKFAYIVGKLHKSGPVTEVLSHGVERPLVYLQRCHISMLNALVLNTNTPLPHCQTYICATCIHGEIIANVHVS